VSPVKYEMGFYIPEDDILHSHRLENLISYTNNAMFLFLADLLEVASVSHRVECSYRHLGNSGEYKQLDSLFADIHSTWASMESYYVKADISVRNIWRIYVACLRYVLT
jgi:hypothetical protein